jgi:hypothetical protein
LECDVIAKHVERLLAAVDLGAAPKLSLGGLEEEGF